VTNLQEGHVPDSVYEQVRKFFAEKERGVTAINSWNRLNIAARTVTGTYQPAKAHAAKPR
jgi:hypothetical protein